VRPEGLGKFERIHLIGKRSRDFPACSIVPQPLRYFVPPSPFESTFKNLIFARVMEVGKIVGWGFISVVGMSNLSKF
jgi:hypothetical protein